MLLDSEPIRTTTSPAIRPRRSQFDLVVLALAAVLFAFSLLVLVPAPTSELWTLAIVIGEWGHYLAVFCLALAAVASRRRGLVARWAAVVAFAAALVCSVPVVKAAIIAKDLPARCTAAFGPSNSDLRAPLSFLDLFRGLPAGAVNVTEHVYGQFGAKKLKLDLYRAETAASRQPLVVVIHGGSWNGGNQRELPALNRYLASHGYAVAAIDYRHSPTWHFPAPLEDVFSAIEFLKTHAAEFGIDADRIVLIGRSAGGQLALSAAYAQRDAAIRGVVAFYAPTDLALGYEKPSAPAVFDSRKVLEDYLGGPPAGNPEAYALASPLNFVDATTPPTLLIQGALDPIVWQYHSELLAARLQYSERPHLYLALPWATHGCDANLSGPSGQLSLYAIERFLESVLRQPAQP